MRKKLRTHYTNLQITENASDEVIKGAYKYLSQKWHPDKNPERREEAERISRIINAAYEVLSDPKKRQAHDEWIREQRRKQEPEQEKKEERKEESQEHREKDWTKEEVAREYEARALIRNFNNVGATLVTLTIFGYLISQVAPLEFVDIVTVVLAMGMALGLLLFGIGRFFIGKRGPRYSSMMFISTLLVCTVGTEVRWYAVRPGQQTFTSAQSSYDKLLADYERGYPQTNPDSPAFNAILTDRIATRMDAYEKAGYKSEKALRLAISEFIESQQRNKRQVPFRIPSTESALGRRNCAYKPVMTDEDYRACGITPPQVR